MSPSSSDRFFDVPRTVHATSEGPVQLPILYRRVRNVQVLFAAPEPRVREHVAGTGLTLVPVGFGRALVALSFYEYLETTVGVYNEVGTAVFVVPKGEKSTALSLFDMLRPLAARRVGMYVLDLPVTTAAANAAGRDIWGYPKFITPIPFQLAGRTFDSAVLDPNGEGEICRMSGTFGRGVSTPPLSLMTYSQKTGALVRTEITVRGPAQLCAPGSVVLSVGSSPHIMAERLRSMGLDGARPLVGMVTDQFQSILPEGKTELS